MLDLFSGAGGMSEGFLQAGFSVPYASDRSQQAAETYINRHKQLGFDLKYYCGDVEELANESILYNFLDKNFNQIDVICGGPPCQGFSLAGKRNPNDNRNKLVKSYIKILSQVKPKYFVMENVLGILSAKFVEYEGLQNNYKNSKVIDVLLAEFDSIGYSNIQIKMLDASDYGVPQKRNRVIFLGTRNDINIKVFHPKPTVKNKISAQEAIDDLSEIENGSTIYEYNKPINTDYQKKSREGRTLTKDCTLLTSEILSNHQTSVHTELVRERFSLLKSGEKLHSLLNRLSTEDYKRFKTKKQNCKKIIADQPSPTVLTLPDDLVHYSKNRILTVREMARLQSFDDSFEFLGKRTTGGGLRKNETPQYTLVGNAVPPLLAKAIASQIMEALKKLEE
ncbi:DNA cytosine methyltransferase [Limnobaculum sp. M2-1]|uniref:DNA cytosine methyltransferase n=1 Tax=Limnobaculum TaxID=2172100 RepID=UPI001C45424E|nr:MULTISPECIES: DNA cytosine methyltransferase [Limnobaculum]MBV7691302.1 DNA cytosine methyltransferase [Limnobaculum sp. M2-1]